jgi:hypothetical protein
VSYTSRPELLPGGEKVVSVPQTAVLVESRHLREAEATLTLKTATPGLSVVFNAAGVYSPGDVEDLKARLGLPAGPRAVSRPVAAPTWAGTAPAPIRTLRHDDRTLEVAMPQSTATTVVAAAVLLGVAALVVAALRLATPLAVAAGLELLATVLLAGFLLVAAAGSLRFRIDGEQRQVIDLKRWTGDRIPFADVRAVVVREIAAGAWVVALLHRHESRLTDTLRCAGEPLEIRAFAGEIARRIGVPTLERTLAVVAPDEHEDQAAAAPLPADEMSAVPAATAEAAAAAEAAPAAEAEVVVELPPPDPVAIERTQAEARARSGANWFIWIAGLSVLNSIAAASGSKWTFIIGLGTTQLIDAIVAGASDDSSKGKLVALVLDINVALLFALFAFFARRRYVWAFYVGMIFYGLDAALFILAKDVLSIGFHVFALYCIYTGLKATRRLEALTPPPAAGPGRFPGPPPPVPPR